MQNFTTFEKIKYVRPDVEAHKAAARQFVADLQAATDYKQAKRLYLDFDKQSADYDTMATVANIRNTMDTRDEFYRDEVEFFDENQPYLNLIGKEAAKVLLASPFVEDFAKDFGEDIVKSAQASIQLSDESIVNEQIEESKLCQDFSRLVADCATDFDGEQCNFYGLLKHMQNTDRSVRKRAFEAWATLYQSVSEQLNGIYLRLIALRKIMASKLGFENYAQMAYLLNGHYYYGAKEVAAFRQQVVEEVVPLATQLFAEQAKRLGVDKLRYYDEALVFPDGNAQPNATEEQMIAYAAQTYAEMSEETDEFFRFMTAHRLFDLTTRSGKHMGGYCTFLPAFGAPFIFSNFNGTSADVDVLTHEAGHAFQAYLSSCLHPLSAQVWSTNEISEIHSMSMEFFAYPAMDKFFGKNADKYRYAHMADTVKLMPYLCLVDHFQHEVYAAENLTGKGLAEIWQRLEKVYMPWRNYDGNAFLEAGGFWMQKQHIFLYPFYYVDYALAQTGAWEYYNRFLADKKQAWEDYLRLCKSGGSKPYFATLAEGNLSNPFASGTVKAALQGIKRLLVNKN